MLLFFVIKLYKIFLENNPKMGMYNQFRNVYPNSKKMKNPNKEFIFMNLIVQNSDYESCYFNGISCIIHVYWGGIAHADTPKSTHEVAIEVINGNYGNGDTRVTNLQSKGFDVKAQSKQKLITFLQEQQLKFLQQLKLLKNNLLKLHQLHQLKQHKVFLVGLI